MSEQVKYSELPVVVFLHNLERVFIGAKAPEQEKGKVCVYSPAMIDIVEQPQNHQIGVRMIPLLFPDFQKDVDQRGLFKFPHESIVEIDVVLADDLVANYRKLLAPRSMLYTPPQGGQVVTPDQINQPQIQSIF